MYFTIAKNVNFDNGCKTLIDDFFLDKSEMTLIWIIISKFNVKFKLII